MEPLLSILIPTVVGRENELKRLINKMSATYNGGDVEVYYERDNKEMPIGEKREKLYQRARGRYSWQIDDDDDIADNAIAKILEAIHLSPTVPCITFRENCMMNGEYKSSNHSIIYPKWMDNYDGYDYVRTPFYKDVIRTDIAQSVPFPKIRYNEDEQWSMALKPLLTHEIHIDEEIYFYIYEPKNTHEERYGIK